MRLLCLDTATFALSAALVELREGAVGNVRVVEHDTGKYVHSVLLPGVLLELLRAEGLEVGGLDGLVAGLGPGSFTGLRTGLATLKGLSYAARVPLVGASSLAAMAVEAARRVDDARALLVPTLDARRGQVYAGFYVPDGDRVRALAADQVLSPEELAELVDGQDRPVWVFGQGLGAYPALAREPASAPLPVTPPATGLARLAWDRVGPYDLQATLSLVPRYVRRSEAELLREAGRLRLAGVSPPAGPGELGRG